MKGSLLLLFFYSEANKAQTDMYCHTWQNIKLKKKLLVIIIQEIGTNNKIEPKKLTFLTVATVNNFELLLKL